MGMHGYLVGIGSFAGSDSSSSQHRRARPNNQWKGKQQASDGLAVNEDNAMGLVMAKWVPRPCFWSMAWPRAPAPPTARAHVVFFLLLWRQLTAEAGPHRHPTRFGLSCMLMDDGSWQSRWWRAQVSPDQGQRSNHRAIARTYMTMLAPMMKWILGCADTEGNQHASPNY